jgi:hypothetical protein
MEIGRFDRTFFSRLDQTRYLAAIQAEAPSQGSLNYALLASLYSVVATGHFDKQKGEGKSGIVPFAGLMPIIDACQKANQLIKHVQT